MNKQKHECTKHLVILCEENKKTVKMELAEIKRQASISDAINIIIRKYKESKK